MTSEIKPELRGYLSLRLSSQNQDQGLLNEACATQIPQKLIGKKLFCYDAQLED